jgi:hypothetical protein
VLQINSCSQTSCVAILFGLEFIFFLVMVIYIHILILLEYRIFDSVTDISILFYLTFSGHQISRRDGGTLMTSIYQPSLVTLLNFMATEMAD